MKKERIYISGAMSGVPREEYLARFAKAETAMRHFYPRVVNPARLAPCRHPWLYKIMGYRLTLAYDLWHLRRCTAIVMLDGWQHSRGARLEHRKARQWGISVITI